MSSLGAPGNGAKRSRKKKIVVATITALAISAPVATASAHEYDGNDHHSKRWDDIRKHFLHERESKDDNEHEGHVVWKPSTTTTVKVTTTTSSLPSTTTSSTSTSLPSTTTTSAPTTTTSTTVRPTTTTSTTVRPTTTTSTTVRPTTTTTVVTRTINGSVVDPGFGPIQIQITVTGNVLTGVTALQYPTSSDSGGINRNAVPKLINEALAAKSANIAAVSGATYTSAGFKQSLQAALTQAGI